MQSLLFVAVVGVVVSGQVLDQDQALERGHIVVHKRLSAPASQDYLVLGRNFSVSYDVLNIGKRDAVNVTFHDDWPEDTFVRVSKQAADAHWDVVAPGANETVTVILQAKVSGTLTSKGASITYYYASESVLDEEEEDLEADEEVDLTRVSTYSTAPGRVDILTTDIYDKLTVNTAAHYWTSVVLSAVLVGWAISQWRAAAAVDKQVAETFKQKKA